ncbi:MAG: helix-turn-helix transcriptional regulator [Bacilli bacterium]
MEIKKDDNKYIYVIVGKNIKRIRKEKGLTQVQLADLVGYNDGTIANIENSSYQTFSLEFIYVISKMLNVPIEEFFKNID